VVVSDTQIYRLKKELGLAKPAPKRKNTENPPVSPFIKGGKVAPVEDPEPEPELPIAAEAEESLSEQTKPEGNGLDPVGDETDFVTSDPQQEQSTDCADGADQIRPVSEQNPPVSPFMKGGKEAPAGTPAATKAKAINRTRGDLPSFSEAILSLLSREIITGCQIKGNPRLSKVSCLKRQVSSGRKRYVRQRPGHHDMMLNGMYHACRGCSHFLPDEDYETARQHVKRGHAIRPTD
jgi:hypothetical protein